MHGIFFFVGMVPIDMDISKTRTNKKAASIKKTLKDISKWNSVQNELQQAHGTSGSATVSKSLNSKKDFRCTLCKRQFKSTEHLERHENESEMHKENLVKLKDGENATVYRDRAR
jgi:hypothetical protein